MYKRQIYPDGVVHAGITFTSTDMKAADTEVSEATLMATFTPGQNTGNGGNENEGGEEETPAETRYAFPGAYGAGR